MARTPWAGRSAGGASSTCRTLQERKASCEVWHVAAGNQANLLTSFTFLPDCWVVDPLSLRLRGKNPPIPCAW
jgi:hypothetical protein